MNMKKIFLVTIFLFWYITSAFASDTILIFGWKNHDEFLGCLNCSEYDKNSIWNEYGTYGNSYNSKSIWNEYGSYGSDYSSTSPFNDYASYPPVLVDYNGWFYWYLTNNEYKNPSNSIIAKYIVLNYKAIRDNVSDTYDLLFESNYTHTSSSSSNFSTSSTVTCGKNSIPNSDNKCSCISWYEWEYPNLSNNYDCKPKITADQACILSYWIYSVSSWWNNCTCMAGYQWSSDRKSCVKKVVLSCWKNSTPTTDWKCSCNTGYIWEYPEISNNYDCKLKPTVCADTTNGYLWTDNKCYCNVGYSWNSASNSCKKNATTVLKCKKWELKRNGKCISANSIK